MTNGATMTIQQFGASVKTKYPAYSQYSDEEIGKRMLEKYPVYKDRVSGATAPTAFTPPISSPSPTGREEDVAAAQKYGALIAPNTKSPSPIAESAKVIANLPGSAWNFAKGALDLLNPISTFGKVKEAVSEFKGLAEDVGGYGKAFGALGKELPGAAYETLVPEAGRGIISAVGGGFTGNEAQVTKGLETAQRAIVSDPVGQIAPFLIAGKGVAKGLSKSGALPGAEAAFDTAISKTAAPVIRATESVAGGVRSFVGGGTKFGVSQATGLKPTTIETVVDQPKALSKPARTTVDRTTVGQEVQGAIARRSTALSETGAAYEPIRTGNATVAVNKGWLDNALKDTTGLELTKGKFKGSGASTLRDITDVRAVQHLYDLWKPVFKRGEMTANEFLNFRTDLAKLSKFERQVGKSQPVENVAKTVRKNFNTTYRTQLKGLDKLDAEFSAQTKSLKELSKGLVDKEGNLTDAGLSRIANLSKTKPNLATQLEELVPGIAKKVRVVQAIEDIQHASGIKVGTYGRAALTGGAFVTGGPIPAIVTAILTSPEVAVPILRSYGLLKNATAVRTVVNALKSAGNQINQLPNEIPAAAKTDITKIKPGAFSPKATVK